jgi:hypothetical protein
MHATVLSPEDRRIESAIGRQGRPSTVSHWRTTLRPGVTWDVDADIVSPRGQIFPGGSAVFHLAASENHQGF